MELYNKKYVYFEWDDELEGKKGFVADDIYVLKRNVEENREEWYGEICRQTIHTNQNYPFEFIPNDRIEELGVLEVDMNAVFLINDGQHRKAAIDKAILEDPSLENETISIVMFKDEGLKRSQQMFTDLNKHAVKTSNSISTLYDGRDKVGVATSNIINKIPETVAITSNEETAELFCRHENIIQREILKNRNEDKNVTLAKLTAHSLVMSNDVIVIGG